MRSASVLACSLRASHCALVKHCFLALTKEPVSTDRLQINFSLVGAAGDSAAIADAGKENEAAIRATILNMTSLSQFGETIILTIAKPDRENRLNLSADRL